MSTERLQTRADLAGLYQQQMQALAYEMRVAMQAIASNSLSMLEGSVAKQEVLCQALLNFSARLQQECRSSDFGTAFPADDVEKRAAATAGAISELNSQYAALLKHSGRSIALLSSLCRSYTGHFPEVHRIRVKQQTWSCEM